MRFPVPSATSGIGAPGIPVSTIDGTDREHIPHKVRGVGQVADRPWQPSRGPTPESRQEPLEQIGQRLLVALLDAIDQVKGRRVAEIPVVRGMLSVDDGLRRWRTAPRLCWTVTS